MKSSVFLAQSSMAKTTSSAVKGLPSDHFMPLRRWNVNSVGVGVDRPLLGDVGQHLGEGEVPAHQALVADHAQDAVVVGRAAQAAAERAAIACRSSRPSGAPAGWREGAPPAAAACRRRRAWRARAASAFAAWASACIGSAESAAAPARPFSTSRRSSRPSSMSSRDLLPWSPCPDLSSSFGRLACPLARLVVAPFRPVLYRRKLRPQARPILTVALSVSPGCKIRNPVPPTPEAARLKASATWVTGSRQQ